VVDDAGGIIYLKGFQLPDAVILSSNVLVIEEYAGKLTYHNAGLLDAGEREPYFTKTGFYPSAGIPQAVYYNGRTYVCFQNRSDQAPLITYYDHATHVWANEVRIDDNPIGTTDSHGSPSIVFNSSGYIHAFWGTHSFTPGYMKHAVSNSPEDISAWTELSNVGTNPSFPIPIRLSNGYIYLFHGKSVGASQVDYVYQVSSNGGVSFGAENTILSYGNNHALQIVTAELYAGSPDRVYLAWYVRTYAPDYRFNCSSAYLNTQDGKMYSVAGVDLGTTVDESEAKTNCLVYDSGADMTTAPQIHLTGTTPYIIFGELVSRSHTWKFARWTSGTSWTVTDIFPSILYVYQFGNFIIQNSSWIESYLPIIRNDTGAHERNSVSLMKISSYDTGATWGVEEIVYNCDDMYYIVRVDVVEDFQDDLKIVFFPEYMFYQILSSEEFSMSYDGFAWGDNGFVHRTYEND